MPIDNYETEGAWSREGNNLTLEGELVSISSPVETVGTDTSATNVYKIEELTDSVLRLSSVIEQDLSQSGTTIISTTTMNLFLVRQ